MGKKIKLLLVIVALSTTISLMSNTYSRYVAGATGSVEASFAKWQILVGNTDITSNSSSNIVLTPTIESNPNVKDNTIAPSSECYFDIQIDPTNADVSFDYTITLAIVNQNIPDLMITEYALMDSEYIEQGSTEVIALENNTISGSLIFNNQTTNFKFEPFTIRIHFKWYEGNTEQRQEQMNDEADTAIGTSDATFKINANISFNQKI